MKFQDKSKSIRVGGKVLKVAPEEYRSVTEVLGLVASSHHFIVKADCQDSHDVAFGACPDIVVANLGVSEVESSDLVGIGLLVDLVLCWHWRGRHVLVGSGMRKREQGTVVIRTICVYVDNVDTRRRGPGNLVTEDCSRAALAVDLVKAVLVIYQVSMNTVYKGDIPRMPEPSSEALFRVPGRICVFRPVLVKHLHVAPNAGNLTASEYGSY